MIYVSNELKQAFLSAEQKNLVITFDDGTVIDNDDIAMESMELEQTLCDSDELKFGKVASACFKTKIVASTKTYKNLWFNAKISVGEHEIALGRFKVYTDNMTSDRLYREIVAYDSLFWAINTDVTEWYNGLPFPITQKELRNSLFDYLGIEQEDVELPNDSITFNRTVNAENLTGLTVLQKLCELNATWGTINNISKFKYARMRTHEHDALYPSDVLYPNNDLFPNDIYDDRLSKANYYQGTLKYEEYDTKPITKVTIREDTEDLGYSYGNDGNTYVIQDNFLMYGASDSTLRTVAKNFYDYAQYIAYTPAQLKTKGAPWREVGDLLFVVADKRTLTVPILNRKLSGITALNDTYIAKGTETYGEVKNGTSEQIKQLQGRANKLTRTLDETKSELQRVETDTDGKLTTMNSTITQTAEAIALEVQRATEAEATISSSIDVTAERITTEVQRATEAENSLSSRIDVTAGEISSKVSKGSVVSEINQSAEEILLKGNRVVIESDNFELTKDGSILIKSGTIDVRGSVTKHAYDYSQEDIDKVNRITIGLIQPTVYDYEKLDLNGDGVIDTSDLIIINKLIRGEYTEYTVDTSVTISPLSKTNIIQTQGVAIGAKFVYSENGIYKESRANKYWAMAENLGYRPGVTGSFSTSDGKTVTVTGGIITSIV